jgi:hypothetical protein
MPPMPGQCLLYKKIIPKVLLKAKSFFDHDGNQGARISHYVHLPEQSYFVRLCTLTLRMP